MVAVVGYQLRQEKEIEKTRDYQLKYQPMEIRKHSK